MSEATDTAGARRVLRRTRVALWAAVGVAVPVAALVVVLATRPPAATEAVHSPLVGKPAPVASGQTIDGRHVSLADFRGRWVLVNFFATWCIPCRKEHPDLVRFAAAHRARGDAVILAIVYDDAPDAVRSFRKSNGGDWPMLEDPSGHIALDFGVSGVPESFLVTPDGVIAAKVLGGIHLADLEHLLTTAKSRST